MERPEILVLICPLVWVHLRCNVQGVPGYRVDVERFMLLGVHCFSHLPSLLLLSGFCFQQCLVVHSSIQPILQFISLIIKKFDLFFSIVCLHKTFVQNNSQNQWLLRFYRCLFIYPCRSPLHLSALWKPTSCFTIWQEKVCQPNTISPGSPVCTSPVWWLYRSYWPTAQTTAWRRFI